MKKARDRAREREKERNREGDLIVGEKSAQGEKLSEGLGVLCGQREEEPERDSRRKGVRENGRNNHNSSRSRKKGKILSFHSVWFEETVRCSSVYTQGKRSAEGEMTRRWNWVARIHVHADRFADTCPYMCPCISLYTCDLLLAMKKDGSFLYTSPQKKARQKKQTEEILVLLSSVTVCLVGVSLST